CLRFAMEYSVIFNDLVARNGKFLQGYNEKMMPALIEDMQKDPELKEFNVDELKKIMLKMIIFSLGLSMMAANNLLPGECNQQDMIDILLSTTDDAIMSAKLRKGFNNEKKAVDFLLTMLQPEVDS
ncbi:MAG: hypothetical protein GX587_14155, partial [Bacteroidales bacterium]|nr:hypothetical protein [Bacteroidales bacterium]